MPKFFASCASSLEYLLVDELNQLGAENVREGLSVVNFEAEWSVLYDILMWSRVASRVMYPVASFEAKDEQALYDNTSIIDWSQHLGIGSSFLVNAQSFRSDLSHTKYVSQRIKDAIVDHFVESGSARPDVDFIQPDVAIHCKIRHNQVTISIDFAGVGLHKRGYRSEGGAAPIKENLAAALLMRAGWLVKCEQKDDLELALYDPMCGSGTFLVEAAMMALDIAPGHFREYLGIFGWLQFKPDLWESTVENANKKKVDNANKQRLVILGSDINPKAVRTAQTNIALAQVDKFIKIRIAGLDQVDQIELPEAGVVIVNPPYSERLGEFDQVKSTYNQLGDLLKSKFSGWNASILCPNKDFGHAMGIRAKKIYKFNNGSIACELLNLEIKSESFVKKQNNDQFDPQFREKLSEAGLEFCNRLSKNRTRLKKFLSKNNLSCYRIYDADLPDYNAAIDVYGDKLNIQEYKAPKSVEPKLANRRLMEIQRAAAGVFEIPLNNVFIKQRRQQKGDWQYETKGRSESGAITDKKFWEINEGGRKFLINLADYLDTGLFIDHRLTRAMVADLSKGKKLLNLFCYTGSVSVYAATAGAMKTVNVDMSNTYLSWAQDNFRLNNIDSSKHQFIRDDSLRWLDEAKQNTEKFDVIFLDPPTFSNSKKMQDHFEVQTDHVSLIENCIELLELNGILIFSNNFAQFKMEFEGNERIAVSEITKKTTSQDFFRKSLHRCWKIQLRA
ncbi:MAG: bifunctional 23S rRNA (guanine(2069)-N(7))-methyltransferase RlmK/23S rRNA (guanine(2445)-N(2))-methyltransferase RlmL [Kangiellaceae bacterium]|nr:bifunctional 23S rRNA (guanine(2069)-N(7))-methyltransferase RlmK/23S rRNA (guanine(2445)-N(2))-methyltransferase RlmL [Kangiellaceae bacterium]